MKKRGVNMTKTRYDCKVKSFKKIKTKSEKEESEKGVLILETDAKETITIKGEGVIEHDFEPNEIVTISFEKEQKKLEA